MKTLINEWKKYIKEELTDVVIPERKKKQVKKPPTPEKKPAPITGTVSYSYDENLIKFIKSLESFKSAPYQVKGDKPTIGYGTTFYIDPQTKKEIPVTLQDKPITEQQADKLIRDYLNVKMPSFNNYLKKEVLNQNQINALMSVMYNMGNKGFLNTKLFTVASRNPNDPAIKNIFLSDEMAMINGVVSQGLKQRRAKEYKLYSTPIYQQNYTPRIGKTMADLKPQAIAPDSREDVENLKKTKDFLRRY